MKAKFLAILIGGVMLAGPALAASIMKTEVHHYKVHGKMVEVHEMHMDDGSVMYGVSKTDLLRMMNRRALEQGHTSG